MIQFVVSESDRAAIIASEKAAIKDAYDAYIAEERHAVERAERARKRSILEDDVAFQAWSADQRFVIGDAPVLLVRASIYGSRSIPQNNEFTSSDSFGKRYEFPLGDPRRPVLMLGSLKSLIFKYDGSSRKSLRGFPEAIVLRYLRRIRHTSVDYEDHLDMLSLIRKRLGEKFSKLSYDMNMIPLQYHERVGRYETHEWLDGCAVTKVVWHAWVDGQYYENLDEEQYKVLAGLYGVLKLIDAYNGSEMEV